MDMTDRDCFGDRYESHDTHGEIAPTGLLSFPPRFYAALGFAFGFVATVILGIWRILTRIFA